MSSNFKRCLLAVALLSSLTVVFMVLNPSVFTQLSDRENFAALIRNTVARAKTHLEPTERPSLSSQAPTTYTSLLKPLGNEFGDRKPKTVASHKLSEAEVAARFKKRREILQTSCRLYSKSKAFRKMYIRLRRLSPYPPVMNLSVAYCPIEKVGSTTWKGIFQSIQRKMKTSGITEIDVDSLPLSKRDILFTFVREPYGRLLSAYVDKLFSPNTLFWRLNGRFIVEKFRTMASNASLKCGNDVTFPEFVKFFIHMQKTGEKRDGHFIPTHDHCRMCEIPYQYIGHLETLSEDMPFLLNAMQSPVAATKAFENGTVSGNIDMLLRTMRKRIQNCTDLDEACRRLWKKWQIRGIISKTQSFPLTKKETDDISQKEFQQVALAAVARAGDKRKRARQKKEALREAFASIPLEDRREVQKLLFLDFEMFGFDPEPEEVFPKKVYKPDPHFSYFDLYK